MAVSIRVSNIEQQERTQRAHAMRQEEVQQALASVRMEGLEPGDEALAIYQRYVDGSLTLEQMGAEIEDLHEREYGPVSVPRNGHS